MLIAAVAAVFIVNISKSAGADGDISVEDDSSSGKNETGAAGDISVEDDSSSGKNETGAAGDEDEGTVGDNEGAADSALSGSGGIGAEGGAAQQGEKNFSHIQ